MDYCKNCSDPTQDKFVYHLAECPLSNNPNQYVMVNPKETFTKLLSQGVSKDFDTILLPECYYNMISQIYDIAGYPIRIVTSPFIPPSEIFMGSFKDLLEGIDNAQPVGDSFELN